MAYYIRAPRVLLHERTARRTAAALRPLLKQLASLLTRSYSFLLLLFFTVLLSMRCMLRLLFPRLRWDDARV